MEREMHLDTIYQIKNFIDKKDYESLKIYIEKREEEIKKYYEKNKASEYVDSLVDNLI